MSTLERAITIAAQAHEGAVDKAGAPYILHPLRVMLKMKTDAERIAAVLHDVVEDTDWTLEALSEEGFAEEVLRAVDHLTRREGESYKAFTKRTSRNTIAHSVKMADIEDNLIPDRIDRPTERDRVRMDRYEQALAFLQRAVRGE